MTNEENIRNRASSSKLPPDLIEDLLEAERIARDPNIKSYSVEEAFEELDNDEEDEWNE